MIEPSKENFERIRPKFHFNVDDQKRNSHSSGANEFDLAPTGNMHNLASPLNKDNTDE
jgi:hypothetical protein